MATWGKENITDGMVYGANALKRTRGDDDENAEIYYKLAYYIYYTLIFISDYFSRKYSLVHNSEVELLSKQLI